MWDSYSISPRGILAGIGFDIVVSLLFGVIVGFIYTFTAGLELDPTMMSDAELDAAFASSLGVQITMLIGGLVISILMGIVAEACAPEPALINAGICGGISMLATFFWCYTYPDSAPIWSQVTIMLTVLPTTIFGGWLVVSFKAS